MRSVTAFAFIGALVMGVLGFHDDAVQLSGVVVGALIGLLLALRVERL